MTTVQGSIGIDGDVRTSRGTQTGGRQARRKAWRELFFSRDYFVFVVRSMEHHLWNLLYVRTGMYLILLGPGYIRPTKQWQARIVPAVYE